MSTDADVREAKIQRLLQEALDLRLEILPKSEHTGGFAVHFQAGKIGKVHWGTVDNAHEWDVGSVG